MKTEVTAGAWLASLVVFCALVGAFAFGVAAFLHWGVPGFLSRLMIVAVVLLSGAFYCNDYTIKKQSTGHEPQETEHAEDKGGTKSL